MTSGDVIREHEERRRREAEERRAIEVEEAANKAIAGVYRAASGAVADGRLEAVASRVRTAVTRGVSILRGAKASANRIAEFVIAVRDISNAPPVQKIDPNPGARHGAKARALPSRGKRRKRRSR